MDYPFDIEKTAFGYATARYENGFGKFHFHMRLPALARAYPEDAVVLTLSAQCSEGTNDRGPEPFYAVRLVASEFSEGLTAENIDRTAKTVRALKRSLAALDAKLGPAVLLEDLCLRYATAAKLAHVYVEPTVERSSWHTGGIPSWPQFAMQRSPAGVYGSGAEGLHAALRAAKKSLLRRAGVEECTLTGDAASATSPQALGAAA